MMAQCLLQRILLAVGLFLDADGIVGASCALRVLLGSDFSLRRSTRLLSIMQKQISSGSLSTFFDAWYSFSQLFPSIHVSAVPSYAFMILS